MERASGPVQEDSVFNILFVCAGNICRSPMAEWLAVAEIRNRFGSMADQFAVASAGTHAVVGASMQPNAVEVLMERGMQPHGFAARELTPELIAGGDLILCAERDHRTAVVTIDPRTLHRTFTLREFHRLASHLTPGHIDSSSPANALGSLLRAAGRYRAHGRAPRPRDDDIKDPYGHPIAEFRRCAAVVAECLRGPFSLVEEAVYGNS